MENSENEKKMISIAEAAAILNVHPNTIRNYIEKGFIDHYTLPTGKKVLLLESDVRKLLKKHNSAPKRESIIE